METIHFLYTRNHFLLNHVSYQSFLYKFVLNVPYSPNTKDYLTRFYYFLYSQFEQEIFKKYFYKPLDIYIKICYNIIKKFIEIFTKEVSKFWRGYLANSDRIYCLIKSVRKFSFIPWRGIKSEIHFNMIFSSKRSCSLIRRSNSSFVL